MLERRNNRRPSTPPVARYVVEDSVSFVLDRSAPRPLIRFEGSKEVWVLNAQPAPKGDTIYKNELGETVLRASGLGGVTVFTSTRPEGAAAAFAGGGPSLRLPPLLNALLTGKRLQEASARAEQAIKRRVDFIAPDIGEESAALVVDAANVAVEAFERLARSEKTPSTLRRLDTVVLLEGDAPSARIDRDQLTIVVAPTQGFAGRPSSERIVRLLRR